MLKFWEICGEKCKFRWKKNVLILIDVNIENILGSSKYDVVEECFKFFIGYVNKFEDELTPLLIKLSKLSGSVNCFWKAKLCHVLSAKNSNNKIELENILMLL